MTCKLCPRECGGDRSRYGGICKSGVLPKLARAALHYGEEPCISGTAGSGTVFFSGCSLGCVFCQNDGISHGNFGREVSVQRLAEIFAELEALGANNINLVNPTHFALSVKQALSIYRPRIPVVYNCGGYEKVETLRLLEGDIDVYLPDIKYADSALAARFSCATDYPETAFAAVAEMLRQTGSIELDDRGIAKRGTLIRHLVLPLHTHDSMAVLDRIASQFGADTWVSLMFQYTPVKPLEQFPELNRGLTARERDRVEQHLYALGLNNGYVQLPESRGKTFIPDFDLTGI